MISCKRTALIAIFATLWTLTLTSNSDMAETAIVSDEYIQEYLNNLTKKSFPIVRPNVTGAPVIVKCNILLENLGPINEERMSFDLDIYLHSSWLDDRLKYAYSKPHAFFNVPQTYYKEFWMPDLVFPNMLSGKMQDITIPNEFLRLYPNGTVLHSTRLSLTIDCGMDLSAYPFDHQKCSFRIASYGHFRSALDLVWAHDYLELPYWRDNHQVSTDQVEMYKHELQYCSINVSTGDYPCVQVLFYFRRHPGYVLLQTYIPTMLVVCMSWVAFWIDPDYLNARASLGGSSIITMSTVFISKTSNIRVSYAFAVDYWVTFCLLFVFFAFFESVIVSYLYRRRKKMAEKLKKEEARKDAMEANLAPSSTVWSSDLPVPNRPDKKEKKVCYMTPRWRPHAIDRTARVGFPVAFVIYNIIYWSAIFGQRHQ